MCPLGVTSFYHIDSIPRQVWLRTGSNTADINRLRYQILEILILPSSRVPQDFIAHEMFSIAHGSKVAGVNKLQNSVHRPEQG